MDKTVNEPKCTRFKEFLTCNGGPRFARALLFVDQRDVHVEERTHKGRVFIYHLILKKKKIRFWVFTETLEPSY